MKTSPPCALALDIIMVALCHHGSRHQKGSSCEHQHHDYYHHSHRPTTMTTTHQDNDHEDQDDDMRQEDIPPHLSHLGTENSENPNEFHNFAGISQQNPGTSRQKNLISLVSRDIPNFLAPTPSRGRPPPQRKISGPKVWVGLPFPEAPATLILKIRSHVLFAGLQGSARIIGRFLMGLV